jgi:N-acyl-D-amino-acid deacylase
MYSVLIKNGTIIDGTGSKPYRADLAISNDKIVAIGDLQDATASEIIDAKGQFLSPGFVDIQNHSDAYWTIFDNPRLDSLVAQGVTTAVVGNCGASLAPLISRDALLAIQKWHNLEGVNLNWSTFEEYISELSKKSFGVNIASLVGYATLRRGLIKDETRVLDETEIEQLSKILEKSIDAGAFGMSSGLAYSHESTIAENELLALAKVLKNKNAMLAVHLRSEANEIVEGLGEALNLLYKSGVNLKISHLKVRGKSNWHLLHSVLHLLEEAYHKKGNVLFDVYPYDFVWQVLYTYLPKWAYEGGRKVMAHNLKQPELRSKILAYLRSRDVDYSNIYIASTSMPLNVIGKSLGEIAKRHGISSEEALLTVVENGGSEILVFDKNLDQKQVEELLIHPLSMIATDGAGFPVETSDRLVHPRCFGSMPKFLEIVTKSSKIPIEKAIQKITSIPAQKIGFEKRGFLKIDDYADIVIFNSEIGSKADYINPYRLPHGISYVFVNGSKALEKGKLTSELNGMILRKK